MLCCSPAVCPAKRHIFWHNTSLWGERVKLVKCMQITWGSFKTADSDSGGPSWQGPGDADIAGPETPLWAISHLSFSLMNESFWSLPSPLPFQDDTWVLKGGFMRTFTPGEWRRRVEGWRIGPVPVPTWALCGMLEILGQACQSHGTTSLCSK